MSRIEPGWYKDPADPVTQRYWDGEGWLGEAIPADATPPDGPPPVPPVGPPATSPPRTVGTAGGGSTAGGGTASAGPPLAVGPPPPVAAPGGVPEQPPTGGPVPPSGWPGAVPPGWSYPPPGWVPPPRPHGYPLAPFTARLVARIIDILAVLGLNVVVNAWFVWQFMIEIAPALQSFQPADPFGSSAERSPRSTYLLYTILIIATALWMAYEVPALGNTGQTLGKRLMHIKVVPIEADKRLGYGRAFLRWGRLGLWTPLWSCCIGFVFQLIDSLSPLFDRPLRQAFHDKAARTVVVQLPPPAGSHDGNDPTGGS